MTIWILFAAMTMAAVMAVLWPLSRRFGTLTVATPDAQFYRDQIAEIDRDLERGLLSLAEAEGAKAEAGRRLLRSAAAANRAADAVGEPALRRRRAVSAIALSTVPLLALAVYGALGSPHLPGQPLAARLQAPAAKLDVATALTRIEQHLAQNPQDGRGWEVIAPVYVRLGRIEDAVKAYEAALRLLGNDATRLANYGEVLVAAQDGVVSAQAREAFEAALGQDSSLHRARFYLARAAEQDGDRDRAREYYEAILANSAADAAWVPAVRDQLARLDGRDAPQAGDGKEAATRSAIDGMVEGLAARLREQGGSAEEWMRLIRSYAVLGRPDAAATALTQARQRLAQDQSGLESVNAMARDLGIASETKP
jgi:cytochrome c-type biogenesis protein CcmH